MRSRPRNGVGRLGRDAGRGRRRADRRSRRGRRRAQRPVHGRRRRARTGGRGEVEYAPRAAGSAEEIRAGLAERREADLRLGRSSWGPHLDEVKLSAAGRSLRRYGSQGQQRAALLALIFAERDALLQARRVAPLLLLDDVMSELDPERRERLVERLGGGGQALITAADEDSLPLQARRRAIVRLPFGDSGGRRRVRRRRAPRPAATALRAALERRRA